MKRLNENIEPNKTCRQEFHFKCKCDGSSYLTSTSVSGIPIDEDLEVKIVCTPGGISVFVNGKTFTEFGTTRTITKIAPLKFTEEHFLEVDELVQGRMTVTGACASVAEKYNHNCESFRQQYYSRHASQIRKVNQDV